MDLIIETVKKLETLMKDSGCEDAGVVLDVNTNAKNCQFERGVCMTASFGGRSADFITDDPVRANTKISFMFGTQLDSPRSRGAAAAMVNVATGFFCLSRVLHSCPESSHTECQRQLLLEMTGKRIYCAGSIPGIESVLRTSLVTESQDADVILINGRSIINPAIGEMIQKTGESTRIVCIGPSAAGVARLSRFELWCPFGSC